jgi:hypothetical protein
VGGMLDIVQLLEFVLIAPYHEKQVDNEELEKVD